MAFLSQTAARPGAADRASGFIAEMKARYAQYRVYRTTLNELQALSDRDLADLGLNRANIQSVAHEAAYGN